MNGTCDRFIALDQFGLVSFQSSYLEVTQNFPPFFILDEFIFADFLLLSKILLFSGKRNRISGKLCSPHFNVKEINWHFNCLSKPNWKKYLLLFSSQVLRKYFLKLPLFCSTPFIFQIANNTFNEERETLWSALLIIERSRVRISPLKETLGQAVCAQWL